MMSVDEIQHARELVSAARDFTRDNGEEETVWPTAEFYIGALYAMDWILGAPRHKMFAAHLAMLEKVRGVLMRAEP